MGKVIGVIWVCAVLLTNFTEYAVAQTTIVAIRTPEEIWIGADSKVTNVHNKSITKSVCKIKQVGRLFYAFAGFSNYTGSSYDLVSIVNKACRNNLSLSGKVKTFEKLIVPPLSKALKRIQINRPSYFAEEIQDKAVIQIVFAGIENGEPSFFVRNIRVEDNDGNSPTITINEVSCPGDCEGGEMVVYLGHTEAIESFLETKDSFWEIGYAAGIRELITIQIEAEPDDVGPPIDMLRISNRGAKWIQKKPRCQEIRR